MGFFSKLAHVLSSKKFKANKVNEITLQRDFVALNIGAINAEQTGCYCNSLETGLNLKDAKQTILRSYDIFDSKSAIEELNYFINFGQRQYYDTVKEYCSDNSKIITEDDISIYDDEQKPRIFRTIKNLNETIGSLCQTEFISRKTDFEKISILAWDMGRLVHTARVCSDLGYITQEQAWEFIHYAYNSCAEEYNNWQELATGYVVGRASHFGDSMGFLGITNIAKSLLNDEGSPWIKYPFK